MIFCEMAWALTHRCCTLNVSVTLCEAPLRVPVAEPHRNQAVHQIARVGLSTRPSTRRASRTTTTTTITTTITTTTVAVTVVVGA